MFPLRRVSAALAAAILLAGPAAFAASGQQGSLAGEHERQQEIATVLGAKVTLQQAIAAAEQSAGGRAARIDVHHENGANLFRVRVLATGAAQTVKIDPLSGKVLGTEKADLVERESSDEMTRLQSAKTSLAAAIDTAEKQTRGRAVEADVEGEHGRLAFEIETVKDNTSQRVRVDVDTGQVAVAHVHKD
jgi:uncharacterized membrane protein YkoI